MTDLPEPARPPRAAGDAASAAVPCLRGLTVALLTTSLALAAHTLGGGAVPSPTGIALLLLVGAAAGAFAGHAAGAMGSLVTGRIRAAHARLAVLAALLAGQGAGHVGLGLLGAHRMGPASHGPAMPMGHGAMGHGAAGAMPHGAAPRGAHAMADMPVWAHVLGLDHGPAMLGAHLGATVLCALLIGAAERLYRPLVRALYRPAPFIPADPAPAPRAPAPSPVRSAPAALVPITPLTRRGPPLAAAAAPA